MRQDATTKIDGQWFGSYTAPTGTGDVILNLDQRRTGFVGSAVVLEHDAKVPSSIHTVRMQLDSEAKRVSGCSDLRNYFWMPNNRFSLLGQQEVRNHFPSLSSETLHADLGGEFDNQVLSATFTNQGGMVGTMRCHRVTVPKTTIVAPSRVSWADFKDAVSTHSGGGLIYRGQARSSPLRTAFHRAGRFDLYRFAVEDLSRLEVAVTSVLDIQFQPNDSRHMGALLGIAQHHGFPTPLLDWTKSPYVAAYFACRDGSEPTIFMFDREHWKENNRTATDVGEALPALGFIEPLPIRNARLLPQQSVLMYSNLDNIERFVQNIERRQERQYLSAYQITDKPKRILRDLRLMGVYAASLFPGLDGMCRGVFEESDESE